MTNVWNEIVCDIDVFGIKSIVIRLREDYPSLEELSCSIENFQDHLEFQDLEGCSVQGMHIPTSGPVYDLREKFNVEYDSGYGGQKLFGTIWMVDGTWWTRGEYDGSEWWEHHECPEFNPDPTEY